MRNNCCLMCAKKITTSISAHLMSLNPLESCYIQAFIKTEFSSFSDAILFLQTFFKDIFQTKASYHNHHQIFVFFLH